ncbi:response regulator [Geodermatophilus sp. SYSU D00758]
MGTRPLRLLVADDDARVRRALQGVLSDVDGLELLGICGAAEELSRRAACGRPDVVLLDLHLPDAGTGLALLARLARTAVRVVAMSAAGGLRGAAMAAGAAGFVEKDGVPEALLEALFAAGAGAPPSAGPGADGGAP